jgi:hypothetical protein
MDKKHLFERLENHRTGDALHEDAAPEQSSVERTGEITEREIRKGDKLNVQKVTEAETTMKSASLKKPLVAKSQNTGTTARLPVDTYITNVTMAQGWVRFTVGSENFTAKMEDVPADWVQDIKKESVNEMSDQTRRERIAALTQAIKDKKEKGDPWEAEKEELLTLRGELKTESNEDKNIDAKMFAKGYRHKLSPKSKKFEPLYVKTAMQAGPVMREYPDERFDISKLDESCFGESTEHPDYKTAYAHAKAQAKKLGIDHGIEKMPGLGGGTVWTVKMMPKPENSYGHYTRMQRVTANEACSHQGRTEKGQFDTADGTGQVMADSEDEPGFAFMKDKDAKDRVKDAKGLGEADKDERPTSIVTKDGRTIMIDPEDYVEPVDESEEKFKIHGNNKPYKIQFTVDGRAQKWIRYDAGKGMEFALKSVKAAIAREWPDAKIGQLRIEPAPVEESEENDDLDQADGVTDGVVADGDEESQMEPIAPKIGESEGDWCRELIKQIGTGVRMNLGMRDMVKDDAKKKLQFRVGGGQMKKMVITLTSRDDYDIEGYKGRGAINLKKVKEFNGIYADQLGEILIKLNSILHGHNESTEVRQRNHLFEALDVSRPEIEE